MTDTWRFETDLPQSFAQGSAVSVGNSIYHFGGSIFSTPQDETYIFTNGSWTTGTPGPARFGACIGVVGDLIFRVGGVHLVSGAPVAVGDVDIYDTSTDSWDTGTASPITWFEAGCAQIGDVLYLFGGEPGHTAVRSYDMGSDSWSSALDPLPTGRGQIAGFSFAGKVYAAGGHDYVADAATDALEVYDPATDAWSSLTSMPTAREQLASPVPVFDGFAYVAGGAEDPSSETGLNEGYDIEHDTWDTYETSLTQAGVYAVAELNGRMHLIGGNAASSPIDTHVSYDPIRAQEGWGTLL